MRRIHCDGPRCDESIPVIKKDEEAIRIYDWFQIASKEPMGPWHFCSLSCIRGWTVLEEERLRERQQSKEGINATTKTTVSRLPKRPQSA